MAGPGRKGRHFHPPYESVRGAQWPNGDGIAPPVLSVARCQRPAHDGRVCLALERCQIGADRDRIPTSLERSDLEIPSRLGVPRARIPIRVDKNLRSDTTIARGVPGPPRAIEG